MDLVVIDNINNSLTIKRLIKAEKFHTPQMHYESSTPVLIFGCLLYNNDHELPCKELLAEYNDDDKEKVAFVIHAQKTFAKNDDDELNEVLQNVLETNNLQDEFQIINVSSHWDYSETYLSFKKIPKTLDEMISLNKSHIEKRFKYVMDLLGAQYVEPAILVDVDVDLGP